MVSISFFTLFTRRPQKHWEKSLSQIKLHLSAILFKLAVFCGNGEKSWWFDCYSALCFYFLFVVHMFYSGQPCMSHIWHKLSFRHWAVGTGVTSSAIWAKRQMERWCFFEGVCVTGNRKWPIENKGSRVGEPLGIVCLGNFKSCRLKR